MKAPFDMELHTMVSLMGYASEPDCNAVRWLPPREFTSGSIFLDYGKLPARPQDLPDRVVTLTLNELIAYARPIVAKCRDYQDAAVKAESECKEWKSACEEQHKTIETLTQFCEDYGVPGFEDEPMPTPGESG